MSSVFMEAAKFLKALCFVKFSFSNIEVGNNNYNTVSKMNVS